MDITTEHEYWLWVNNTAIPNYWPTFPTPNEPQGALRIRQLRVETEWDFCDSYNETCFELYDQECAPYYTEGREYSDKIESNATCIMDDCSELDYEDKASYIMQCQLNTYSSGGYVVDIYANDTQKGIELLKGNWTDHSTRFLATEIAFKNDWIQGYAIIRAALELPGDGSAIPTFRYYYYNPLDFELWPFSTMMFFIYFINVLVYSMKVIYEMSLDLKGFMHLGSIVGQIIQFTSVLMTFIVIGYHGKLKDAGPDDTDYYNFAEAAVYNGFEIYYYAIACYFLPFRIFSLISWSNYTKSFSRFGSTIYRIFPIITFYLAMIMVLYVAWSIGFFISFHTYMDGFRDFLSAFLSFMFTNSIQFGNSDKIEEITKISGYWAYLPAQLFFLELLRIIIFVILIAVVIDAYRKSCNLEVTQNTIYEDQISEQINEISVRLEKMQKQVNSYFTEQHQGDDIDSGGKMLVWFDSTKTFEDRLVSDARAMGIQVMPFSKLHYLFKFLRYLFRLKPKFLSSKANKMFRIIALYDDENNSKPDTSSCEIFADWLRNTGCRAPLLLYGRVKLEFDHIIHIKKKYNSLLETTQPERVISFTKMNELNDIFPDVFRKKRDSDVNHLRNKSSLYTYSEDDNSPYFHEGYPTQDDN